MEKAVYRPLPTIRMRAGVICLPPSLEPLPVKAETPAIEVMTDLRAVAVATIRADATLARAAEFDRRGIRSRHLFSQRRSVVGSASRCRFSRPRIRSRKSSRRSRVSRSQPARGAFHHVGATVRLDAPRVASSSARAAPIMTRVNGPLIDSRSPSLMRLVYLLPLVIALGFAWLGVRYALERRHERAVRERLRREPRLPKAKSHDDSERSEMRACEDTTTMLRTIKRKPTAEVANMRGPDGTRSPTKP